MNDVTSVDVRVAEIAARAEARIDVLAPNTAVIGDVHWSVHPTVPSIVWIGPVGYADVIVTPNEATAEFIAHARDDIPFLLSEVRRLRSVVEDAEKVIATISKSAREGLADCDEDYEMSSLWVLEQCNTYRAGADHDQ